MRLRSSVGVTLFVIGGLLTSSCADAVVVEKDLGPVPGELAKLDVHSLRECTAVFEWVNFQSKPGHSVIKPEIATLYRDVWLMALNTKTSKSHNPKDILKNSDFKEDSLNHGSSIAPDKAAQRCTRVTADALETLGFETGLE
jgi:hypothetical protein